MNACAAAGADIDELWHDAARQRLRAAFVASGASDAAAAADRVMPWLDQRARGWKEARTEVCLNAEVRALWSAELQDRATWCLADRRLELAALVEELGRASPATVQKAVLAVAGLRAADDCASEELVRRQAAPPSRGREAIRELRAQLSRADALAFAGQFEAALALATGARERAEHEVQWPPLVAAALAQEGIILEKTGAYEQAEAATRRAYFTAARAGAWDVAAGGASDLIRIVGHRQARHADGRAWAEHAAVALAHAGDPLGLAEAARLDGLATLLIDMDAFPEAQELFERALAIGERVLGPDHPNVARTLGNLAILSMHMGAPGRARALLERVLAIHEAALGPEHPLVADTLNNLSIFRQVAGEYAEARALAERALAIKERAVGPDHPDVAGYLNNLANLLETTGAHAQARALHERGLALTERAFGPDHPHVAQSLFNLATVLIATGEGAAARALLERALAIQEAALGPEHLAVAATLDSLGALGLAEERPDALPLLERAAAIYARHEGWQEGKHRTQFHLAQARLAAGGDRVAALGLARAARDGLQEEGPGQARALAEVEQWLAGQGSAP